MNSDQLFEYFKKELYEWAEYAHHYTGQSLESIIDHLIAEAFEKLVEDYDNG